MSNEVSLDLKFNYNKLRYEVSMSYLSGYILPDSPSSILYQIFDSSNVLMSLGTLAPENSYSSPPTVSAYGTSPFGFMSSYSYAIERNSSESGSVYYTNPYAEFRIDHNIDPSFSIWSGTIRTALVDPTFGLSRADDKYSGVPVQFGRGEVSLNALVTARSGSRITWENNDLITSVGQNNFVNAKVTIISGSQVGNEYRVVSADNTSKYLYLDKTGIDIGQLIQVSPRASVVSYSGWEDSLPYRSKFNLDRNLAIGVGNYSGVITYSGSSTYNYAGIVPILTSTCNIPKDIYGRSPAVGDMIKYTDSIGSSLSGLIIDVEINSTNYGIKFYPRNTPGPTNPNNKFTLVRATEYDVELYPQFGENYNLVVSQAGTNPFFKSEVFHAPVASMEITAGDYDSAFASVADTSHFHIGPVHLSDGTIIERKELLISGRLYNNNPTSPTVLTSWYRFNSNDSTAAKYYAGTYTRFNQLIGTYSQAFITPDIVTVLATASLGSAKLDRTISMPVQPPI